MNFYFLFLRLIQFVLQGYKDLQVSFRKVWSEPIVAQEKPRDHNSKKQNKSTLPEDAFTLDETSLAKWHLKRF